MKYVFIFGLPRSGSTLLASILDSHSEIFVQHEDHVKPFRDIPNKNEMNLKLKVLSGLERYLDMLVIKRNKSVVITSRYFNITQAVDILSVMNPKFIIITRKHPWRTFFKHNGNPVFIPFSRIFRFAMCRVFLLKKCDCFEIGYSDLVKNTSFEIEKLCRFIGVEFEPEMLHYWRFDHSHYSGNKKTNMLHAIVDKSKSERLSFKMVFDFIKYRFILRLRG